MQTSLSSRPSSHKRSQATDSAIGLLDSNSSSRNTMATETSSNNDLGPRASSGSGSARSSGSRRQNVCLLLSLHDSDTIP
ncbi:hypothetical protein EJ08DRAFT_652274 [Tothia fuscella]|uniref:Uncharacterized protein n=1 Tax=Tothia fuscella TaxID=1048955 RepID=A0A9P4TVC5_9PEZI|nr:hypothetical protein EJ08DRAFT_652274 [Tothia fuscella]